MQALTLGRSTTAGVVLHTHMEHTTASAHKACMVVTGGALAQPELAACSVLQQPLLTGSGERKNERNNSARSSGVSARGWRLV